MKRGAGFLALFAFLITGLRFASGPATIKESSGAHAAERFGTAPKMPMRHDTTCEAFEYPPPGNSGTAAAEPYPGEHNEIATLIDRYLYGSAEQSHLGSGTLPEGIRVMIMTVPDPVHTHLSLQFDRTLEALQQAAQDERYTYESSWLPWRTKTAEYSSVADQNTEAREAVQREACPGVVLFRRNMSAATPRDCRNGTAGVPRPGDAPYLCGLFVFVVGEKPTSGLDRVQWNNALAWISEHTTRTRDDTVLRVLAPTFSGSMPSFVRALQDANKYVGTFTSTLLYTGRIRGCASWQWLKAQLNPRAATPPGLPIRAEDFEENDSLQSDRFYRYLKDRGHLLSEIAIVSEDETTYGGLPDARTGSTSATNPEGPHCGPEYGMSDRPVHLYYPRDISAVRSAYQEQSIFSAPSKTDTSSQPHTVLQPESNSNDHEESDTIEPYSGNNKALTQEAQLYGIVNALKTHGIRYIILRSTNSLDYLFLTRFLHRTYSTAYIVTMGSDLLFAREVDTTEFRGVVALSSFPLLPRGQDWTLQTNAVPQHAHRIFGSYTMEGAYLAGRFLITDPGVSAKDPVPYIHPAKPDIPDYALPFWDPSKGGDTSHAATWLAVIGRDGYWPLATLTEPLGKIQRFSNLALVAKPQSKPPADPQDTPRPQRLSLSSSWRFFCVLAVLMFGMHYFACRYGWDRPDLGMFVQFTRLHGARGPALIATGWAAICCLLLILFLTSVKLYQLLDSMDQLWVLAMGIATATACVFAIFELRWWSQPVAPEPALATKPKNGKTKHGKAWNSQLRWYRFVTALMFAAIVLFGAAGWLIFEFGSTGGSGVTTAYRSVHLTSGVSPVVSLIAMLAGFYWWFWQSLSGLALLGDGRPVLPRSVHERGTNLGNQIAERIEQAALPFPHFGKSTRLLYLLPLFVVALLAIVLQRAWVQAFDLILHSLENTAFNRTLHVLIGIALYLILLECTQFYSTWLVLKRLLLALDRLPLRRTFAALQGLSMRSLWRLSGTSSRARYKIFSHQLESLLHLRNELDAFELRNCGGDELRQSVQGTLQAGKSFVERRNLGKDFAMVNDKTAKDIRIIFRSCSETVLEKLLIPEWQAERGSLDVHETAAEGEAHHEQIRLSDNIAVQVGEEFLCLIYVGYLQNLLGRMRTMVLSVAGLFAAIAISVGFYPYTPRPIISLSLLLLLLLIGAVVGTVFAGLDRDSTLSHITNTEPGALGAHFWLRMFSFIGVPALGLIVAQFPEITDFVFSWIQPSMSAVK